jgi:hypothetical protein
MYMQHVKSDVGGKTRSTLFGLLDREFDRGAAVAKEPEATMKLKAAREGRYMVVMKEVWVVGKGVCLLMEKVMFGEEDCVI